MDNVTRFKKLCLSFIFVCFWLILLKPFIIYQLATRGGGYLTYNMHNDAIRQYKKALLLSPHNSEIMNWLGFAYKSAGDKKKAIDTYKKAIKINPQNLEAYHDLGVIYIADKEYKLAKEYFLKASSAPHNKKRHSDEDYAFYRRASLKMLNFCQKKIDERGDRYEK